MIDLNLIKQVTDLADWFTSFPTKLVDAVMGTKQAYIGGKEKIAKLNELAALREIGQSVNYLYLFKGNVYSWINRLQTQRETEGVEYVRTMFQEAATRLAEVERIMQETSLSNLQLAAEAGYRIAEAKQAYEALGGLSDADILGDRGVIDIIAVMDRMIDSGAFLMRLADSHREKLEATGAD